MKLGSLDIIGDRQPEPRCTDLLRLRIREEGAATFLVADLNADETERLITYLKGLRDGLGWNRKAAKDRSL